MFPGGEERDMNGIFQCAEPLIRRLGPSAMLAHVIEMALTFRPLPGAESNRSAKIRSFRCDSRYVVKQSYALKASGQIQLTRLIRGGKLQRRSMFI